MKRLIFIIPVLLFGALAVMLYRGLLAPPPQELPSVLIDKPAPRVTVPPLNPGDKGFGPADLAGGHVTVLNTFASWCVPCRDEASVLPELAHIPGVAFYGMVYKDTPENARAFLNDVGNPFMRVGLDESGSVGIQFGLYGVPETYVIDGKGVIRLRHAGPLTPEIVKDEILPAVNKARAAG